MSTIQELCDFIDELVADAAVVAANPTQAGYDELAGRAGRVSDNRGRDFSYASRLYGDGDTEGAARALTYAAEEAERHKNVLLS